MARRGAPWEIPDLQSYREALVQAVREGPLALNQLNLNTIWDYRPSAVLAGFLNSYHNTDDDQDWRMVRPIGAGAFGQVGLWRVVRADGSVADEIAIKQGDRLPQFDFDSAIRPGLAKEAVLQYQVNGRNCENIVHLRCYKFYSNEQKHRFYMEYCPYGDLERLRIRYRAKATRLPELFLWHLFHSLAQAISAMQGPWSHFISGGAYPKDHHMLHMDLKHDNVFLGYERSSNVTSNATLHDRMYPTIKVGDFGLAAITGPEDSDNPINLWGTGTEDYMPPEQRHFGIEWPIPPNHGRRLLRSNATGQQVPFQHIAKDAAENDYETWSAACRAAGEAGFKFSSEQNVWGVGKIVMDMLNLAEPSDLDEVFDASITEESYKRDRDTTPYFSRVEYPEYSARLIDLVERCLRFEKALRPTPTELLTLTDAGLKEVQQNLRTSDMDMEQARAGIPRVYFKENEINQMPRGNVVLKYRPGEWDRLFSRYRNPDWEPLIPDSAFRKRAMEVEPGTVQSPRRIRPRPFRFQNGQLATAWNMDDRGRIVFENEGGASGSQDTLAYPHMSYCDGECGNRCADAAAALRQQEQNEAQQQQQQQQQQQPPPIPPGPLRTVADYRKLRIQDLEEDLRDHRGVFLATVTGTGTHKENLIARVMQEDQNGNLGRGPVRGTGVTRTRAGKKRKRPAR